ncbi:MAG TPA: polysaccharide deacetylase family protein [Candidatus Saccharimonadia bacterium]
MKRFAATLASVALVALPFVQPFLGRAMAVGTNLIANPSVEIAAGSGPSGWDMGGWGTNTASLTYDTTGAQDGSRSLGVSISSYTNGDAKWYFSPVTVSPNTQYTFSDYYQSNVATEIDAQITDTAGNVSYAWLADVPASTAWKPVSANFTTSTTAKNVTIFHVLAKVGTLKTDNFSLATTAGTTPTPTVTPAPTATPTPTVTPTPVPTTTPTPTPVVTPTPTPVVTPTPANGNTIPNPGLETAGGTNPANWASDAWGTNTSSFSYLTTGHAGSRSVQVTVSAYTNGSADWYYAPQAVQAGGHYRFTDWYRASVDTEVDAGVTMSDGTTLYYYLGKALAATNWAQFAAEFDMPAGAVSATIFHLIAAKGTLTTDDYSFGLYQPAPFTRGIISVTYDDGWHNQYTNALPIMNKYGLKGTYYIISGELTNQPDYMTVAEIAALKSAGNEIASHSVTHPDLTTVTATKLTNELKNSQATLQSKFGGSVTDFAYPYGAYNAKTIAAASLYYQTQRSTDSGYNTKDNLTLTNLKVQNIFNTTTPAQVQAWINQAAKDHSWLILVYHEVGTTPIDPTDTQYTTTPADLDAEMAMVKNSGLGVLTINQAVNEVLPQIGK